MKDDKSKLIGLFERKINLLLENNKGYSRFKGRNPMKKIKHILSGKSASEENIIDLGFLIHLAALKFRLNMYKNLTPFTILSFKKDLQEIINSLHAYQRLRNPRIKLSIELAEVPENKKLIPPFVDVDEQGKIPSDNPELYNEILNRLGEDAGKIDVEIPEDIIREMQYIDLNKIYDGLSAFIERKRCSTIRKLASDFPVFENDKLSLVAVFNEVLFLANEGRVHLQQMDEDIGISMSI